MKILKLPQELISRIAAGQVVERPSSVVKELLENSLDAGATEIDIYLKKSGLHQIMVVDNGNGMDKDNLKVSFLPHTTSKISSNHDLTDIQSLGFRGEALASICAIASLTIKSRVKDKQTGNQVILKKGKLSQIQSVGMAQGTSVEVTDLFKKIPARLKHLKSPTYEMKAILLTILSRALAHPETDFKLTHNEKVHFVYRKTSRKDRIRDVLGKSFSDDLFEIKSHTNNLRLSGFIGHPQIASRSRTKSYLYINNRPVLHPSLTSAIKKAYGTLLDPKSFPNFVLFLTIPTVYVDVNITPTKDSVSLSNEKEVLQFVYESVTKTLEKHNLMYRFSYQKSYNSALGEKLKKVSPAWDMRETTLSNNSSVISLDNVYLAVSTENGILLIDQHAAHERILYNQFKKALSADSLNNLVAPDNATIISLSASDSPRSKLRGII